MITMATRLKRSGAAGHITAEQRDIALQRWNERTQNRGTLTLIAKEIGVSHVAISNLILSETGMRPAFHSCPKEQIKKGD